MSVLVPSEGHLPVHQVLRSLGFTHPSSVWKDLLASPEVQLPSHTRMQFERSDGRKSPLMPAIHHEDLLVFCEQVKAWKAHSPGVWVQLPAEREVIRVLQAAFQDLSLQSPCEINGKMVDVYFHTCKVALVFDSPSGMDPSRFQRVEHQHLKVLVVGLPRSAQQLGRLIQQLRQALEGA